MFLYSSQFSWSQLFTQSIQDIYPEVHISDNPSIIFQFNQTFLTAAITLLTHVCALSFSLYNTEVTRSFGELPEVDYSDTNINPYFVALAIPVVHFYAEHWL